MPFCCLTRAPISHSPTRTWAANGFSAPAPASRMPLCLGVRCVPHATSLDRFIFFRRPGPQFISYKKSLHSSFRVQVEIHLLCATHVHDNPPLPSKLCRAPTQCLGWQSEILAPTVAGGDDAPLIKGIKFTTGLALAGEMGVDVTHDILEWKFYALSHCWAVPCFPSAAPAAYLTGKLLYQPGSPHAEEMGWSEK